MASCVGKVALMERFDGLLWALPGRVELAAPEERIGLVEDCRAPEPDGGWGQEQG